jgi:hypothetical protein
MPEALGWAKSADGNSIKVNAFEASDPLEMFVANITASARSFFT